MNSILHGLAWAGAFVVLAFVFGWVGLKSGRHLSRKYPSAASALWMLSMFLKIDPPPPPKMHQAMRDDDAPGDPPKL